MTYDPYSSTEPKRSVAIGPLVWGLILITIGAGWLFSALDIATVPWRAVMAAILVIVGLALLIVSSQGAAPEGLFTAGTILAVILALLSTFSSAFSLPLAGGVGDRSVNPTISTIETEYHMVAGQLEIDLSEVTFPQGETRLEAGVTFGRIVIDGIPANVAVSVAGSVAAGELLLLGSHWDGLNIEQRREEPHFADSARRLVIDVQVGFGQIEVQR